MNLSPGKHLNKITRETNNPLSNRRAALAYLDKDMIRKISVTLIFPKLKYAIVWSL